MVQGHMEGGKFHPHNNSKPQVSIDDIDTEQKNIEVDAQGVEALKEAKENQANES